MAANELDINTLNWVKSEIDETMKQARNSLEAYVEEQDDESQLRFCINHLHQVFGTLQMVELYGASLLAEELEDLAKAVLDNKVKNKNDAFEIMMRGCLQLPDYLEQLQTGYKDTPMVLMPLLNDLRSARGEALLSETALFNPNLNIDPPKAESSGEVLEKINDVAKNLRHQYHLGLLGWFQNKDLQGSFKRLAKVLHAIRQSGEEPNTLRMLWIAEGVIESLINKGIESSVSVKLLMGRIDRKIKEIIDNGEVAMAIEPPAELLKNMLYYVASSSADGKYTSELKKSFQLSEIMPDTKTLEKARADLVAPNAQLLDTVSSVMKDDLQQVQDILDVFVRSESQDMSQLQTVADKLEQMSDTLGMLGLGPERNTMTKQVENLQAMVKAEKTVDESELMDIASSMITLERTLSDLGAVKRAQALKDSKRKPVAETAEQRKLLESVIKEAKVDINNVKETITDFSKQLNHPELLNDVPAILDKVRGSLRILNLERAANLMSQCRDYIEYEILPLDKIPDTQMLDYLADAISSIEYYMESLIDSWGEPSAILDVAEVSLSHLIEEHSQSMQMRPQPGPEEPEIEEEEDSTLIDLQQPGAEKLAQLHTREKDVSDDDDSPDTLIDIEQPVFDEPDEKIEAIEIDEPSLTLDNIELPESLELGPYEESLELSGEFSAEYELSADKLELDDDDLNDVPVSTHIERLDEALGLWFGDVTNKDVSGLLHDVLLSLQEHAETKNKDKAVKVCKDIQNIVSRVTHGEEQLTEDTKNTLFWARDTLNNEFNLESPTQPETGAKTDEKTAHEESTAPVISAPEQKYNPIEDIDEEIFNIFLEEAEEEYQNISRLLPVWVSNVSNEEPLSEMRRSFHTLKGSGRLVGATDVGEFAWAFENMMNRVIDRTITPDNDMFDLLDKAKDTLPYLFKKLVSGERPNQDVYTLMEQANALSRGESISATKQGSAESQLAVSEDAGEDSQGSLREITQPRTEELSGELIPDIDPALRDIYKKEVATHLQSLQDYIADWKQNKSREATNQLYRALHTLTGSARTTGVLAVSELCGKLENYTKCLQKLDQPVDDDGIGIIEESASFIHDVCQQLDSPGNSMPDSSSLLLTIDKLTIPLQDQLSQENEEQSIQSIDADEYDEELLEIFIEEGTEILDESDHTLHDWINDRENMDYIESLQRQLHTLKGGARMSGVKEMGNLSHRVESLLTSVVDGDLQPSQEMFDVLLRAQDSLVAMLDEIRSMKHPAAATEINNALDALLGKPSADASINEPVEPVESVEMKDSTQPEDKNESQGVAIDQLETIELARPEKIELHEEPVADFTDEIEVSDIPVPELDDEVETEQADENISIDLPGEVENTVEQQDENEAVLDLSITPADDIILLPEEDKVSSDTEPAQKSAAARPSAAEQVRIRADLLDNLVNFAGEVSIYRSRLEQQSNTYRYNLQELDDTVARLRDQLRKFDIEAEAQISHRKEEALIQRDDFDPLEFDRFTQMQQLSRSMMESMNDIESLRSIFNNITRESETLLLQQSRITTELQEGLLRTRMIPFTGQIARLRRIVRQTSAELGKPTELELVGAENEIDRTIVERIMPSVEHMLRNAIAHGIESPEQRKASGKPAAGNIKMSLSREGSDIVLSIEDDGAGINLDAIRQKALAKGLIKPDQETTPDMLINLILESGFSTAEEITQVAGRGVGMDVVNSDIKQMGGLLNIQTEQGKGSRFTVSMPLTLAVTRALMVQVGDEQFALPLMSVEGVERLDYEAILDLQQQEKPVFEWIGESFNYINLGSAMGLTEKSLPAENSRAPILLVRSGEYRAAIHVDGLIGSREIVVKPVGPELSTLRGISGATIMGDGNVVLIIDLGVLIRLVLGTEDMALSEVEIPQEQATEAEHIPVVMVVDDSITVRKVTTRFLERNDFKTMQAKDGVDALQQLIEHKPDIMLLDVEMPRMDGFELATNIRNDDELKHIPIIMITSRTGEKHRQRAMNIGVNNYMGKPYNEAELLESIQKLIKK